jgi:ankyrin repeat protein
MNMLLRDSVIDANLKDKSGRSPLLWAVINNQREAVNDLLRNRHVHKATKDDQLRNAISWACQTGNTEILDLLIQNKCGGEDDVDVDGWTPLLWALFNQSRAIIEVLLWTGRVEIDRQDRTGRTALIWAANYGYLDVVQLLVTWKADLHVKNEDGLTAAGIARLGGYTEIWEFLERIHSEVESKPESQIATSSAG